MSFYSEKKYLQEQPKEVRQVKKSLPYSISEIGGSEDHVKWLAEQKRRQEIWDSGRADRYAVAKQRAIEVLQGLREPSPDKNAEIEKQYLDRQRSMVKAVCRPEIQESSFLQRVYHKILNFFLDLKF